jgi:hypothetical protein
VAVGEGVNVGVGVAVCVDLDILDWTNARALRGTRRAVKLKEPHQTITNEITSNKAVSQGITAGRDPDSESGEICAGIIME